MKSKYNIYKILFLSLLIVIYLLAAPQTSRADIIYQIADALDFLDSHNIPNPLAPDLTGTSLRNAHDVLECIADGRDVLLCVHDHGGSTLDKELSDAGEDLPQQFKTFIEVYGAVKDGSFTELIDTMPDLICAIAQVVLQFAVCGVIKALIAVGKAVVDAFEAVVHFFADLFGGGDSPPAVPEWKLAYDYAFAPQLGAPGDFNWPALGRCKSGDGECDKLKNELIVLATTSQTDPNCQVTCGVDDAGNYGCTECPSFGGYSQGAANQAAETFRNNVCAQWTGDALVNFLVKYNKAQNDYPSPEQIDGLAPIVIQGELNSDPVAGPWYNPNLDTSGFVKRCVDDLNSPSWNPSNAVVSRWMAFCPDYVSNSKLPAKTNLWWCGNSVWIKKYGLFTDKFISAAHDTFCPGPNLTLNCPTSQSYDKCKRFMMNVKADDKCLFDISLEGKDMAEKIRQSLLDKGSKYPCTVGSVISGQTVELSCSRPSLQHYCNNYQADRPRKSVNCALKNVDVGYEADMIKVRKAAIALSSKYSQYPGAVDSTDFGDPLVVRVRKGLFEIVRNDMDYQWFYFDNGTSYLSAIDGVNKPTMAVLLDAPNKAAAPLTTKTITPATIKNGIAPGPDPKVIQLATSPSSLDSGKSLANAGVKQSVNPAVSSNIAAQQSKVAGAAAQTQATAPTKAMSATVQAPTSSGAPAAGVVKQDKASLPVAQAPSAVAKIQALPDITANDQVTLGGKTVNWQSTINLDAKDAQRTANGLCVFAAQYAARNAGTGSSGAFHSTWTNSVVTGSVDRDWPGMAAGMSATQTDTINLKPGPNVLTLTLDSKMQLKESNENNNQFKVTVNLTGQCGAAPVAAPKVPAVQQPVRH